MKNGTKAIIAFTLCLFASTSQGLQSPSLFPTRKLGLKKHNTLTPARFATPATPDVIDEKEKTAWTEPRLHNTQAFRSVAILGALVAAGASSKSPMAALSNTAGANLHVLMFGSWFGMVVYTTFVAGITMFKNLPKQTFGKLQAKLFPKYFFIGSAALILQLLTLRNVSVDAIKSQTALGIALATTLLNQFILEPKSTSNMMKRYDMEDAGKDKTDEYKKLKSSFGKFHGISSLLNLIGLCAGVAHGVYLAAKLAA